MYTDLLTKIHNAQKARKETLKVPYTNMDFAVVELLMKYGFVKSAAKKGRMPKRVIEIGPQYNEQGIGAITDVAFVSKPSRRIYAGYRNLKPVKQGYGIAVISTPMGIVSSAQAKKQKVGGEVLFEIW